MNQHRFLERLRKGEVLLGVCQSYATPAMVELVARGWDVIWLDGQHGHLTYESALAMIQAAGAVGVETLLRIYTHDRDTIAWHCDLAPSALMIPMVNTPEEADAIVRAMRFPPRGARSYGGRRPIDIYGREYYRQLPLGCVVQIETVAAVERAHEIAAVDGVDMLFFGPDDMKVSLKLPINTPVDESPQLQEMMRRTAAAARQAGKFAAAVAVNGKTAKMAVDMGFQLLIGGSEVMFIRSTAPKVLAELRTALGQPAGEPQPGTQVGSPY